MASTFEHMAARDDRDLTDRLIAAAEQLGIANSRVARDGGHSRADLEGDHSQW